MVTNADKVFPEVFRALLPNIPEICQETGLYVHPGYKLIQELHGFDESTTQGEAAAILSKYQVPASSVVAVEFFDTADEALAEEYEKHCTGLEKWDVLSLKPALDLLAIIDTEDGPVAIFANISEAMDSSKIPKHPNIKLTREPVIERDEYGYYSNKSYDDIHQYHRMAHEDADPAQVWAVLAMYGIHKDDLFFDVLDDCLLENDALAALHDEDQEKAFKHWKPKDRRNTKDSILLSIHDTESSGYLAVYGLLKEQEAA